MLALDALTYLVFDVVVAIDVLSHVTRCDILSTFGMILAVLMWSDFRQWTQGLRLFAAYRKQWRWGEYVQTLPKMQGISKLIENGGRVWLTCVEQTTSIYCGLAGYPASFEFPPYLQPSLTASLW